ncbi:MAG: holo-ACP synthase [Chloroflexota bacterium]|jgi:holo-[acyl-carrier protein] synthase
MLSVGVDLIEIARIERGFARHGQRFYDRFFTVQEQTQCEGRTTSLAGRFAVKEAVAKALGTGIGDMRWLDIEVVCDNRGRPELLLHAQAQALAQQLNLTEWAISISHTDSHAVGMAVALGSKK